LGADLVADAEGTRSVAMLFRYPVAGDFAGDTWHQYIDDAMRQDRSNTATHWGKCATGST
jgi:hypothetical protein